MITNQNIIRYAIRNLAIHIYNKMLWVVFVIVIVDVFAVVVGDGSGGHNGGCSALFSIW